METLTKTNRGLKIALKRRANKLGNQIENLLIEDSKVTLTIKGAQVEDYANIIAKLGYDVVQVIFNA